MNLIPYSCYVLTVLDCKKRPFLPEFLDEPDTPIDIQVPPPPRYSKIKCNIILKCKWAK